MRQFLLPAFTLCLPLVGILTGCTQQADPEAGKHCEYKLDAPSATADDIALPGKQAPTNPVHITLETTSGSIPITLEPNKSPCTVNAIDFLAKQGFFNGSTCHRLTTEGIYVLQCGDPTGTGRGGPGFSFPDEYPVSQSNSTGLYKAGTIAMANHGPATNGSQFFLTYKDSKLPPNYTIFGHVDPEGLTVLDTIAARGTVSGDADGSPAEPVTIERATVTPN